MSAASSDNNDERYPFFLPLWSRYRRAESPDGRFVASVSGSEISMGNPTIGELHLSDGLTIKNCNTALLWSADSRYLAVPQWRFLLGLQLRQRILLVDAREKVILASRPLGWFIYPGEFRASELTVEIVGVHRNRKAVSLSIDRHTPEWTPLSIRW